MRFDAVCYGHFESNRNRLVDNPILWACTRELYLLPEIAETFNMDHFKTHYYGSHTRINPSGIVPLGPKIGFDAVHGRDSTL